MEFVMDCKYPKCRLLAAGGFFRRGISGGERKRVSVGHEMIINPSVLLLDEPTSGMSSPEPAHTPPQTAPYARQPFPQFPHIPALASCCRPCLEPKPITCLQNHKRDKQKYSSGSSSNSDSSSDACINIETMS